ncbi:MAG: HAMP domain-containing sensor histidine kinase [bacterium]|nr:HAMP domain-containing sensor histidine kinase [bacterium]
MKLTLVAVLCIAFQFAHAHKSDPYALVRQRVFTAFVVPMPGEDNRFLKLTPRPVWSVATPAISFITRRGLVLDSALVGADVRAAVPWQKGILAVQCDGRVTNVLFLDKALNVFVIVPLDVDVSQRFDTEIRILAQTTTPYALVSVGDRLYVASIAGGGSVERDSSVLLTCRLLEDRVRGAALFDAVGPYRAAFVSDVGNVAYLTVLDSVLERRITPSVPMASVARIDVNASKIVVRTPIDEARGTQVTVVDPVTTQSSYITLNVPAALVATVPTDEGIRLAVVAMREGRYELAITPLGGAEQIPVGEVLPGEFGQPRVVLVSGDTIYILFSGGIVSALSSGEILSRDAISVNVDAHTAAVSTQPDGVLFTSARGSLLLSRTTHQLWMVRRFLDTALRYILPLFLLICLGVLYVLYRRQRRTIDAMIDLPGAGVVFMLDANGRLLRTNERGAKLLRITKNVPMRRLYRSYMVHDDIADLLEFLTHVTIARTSLSEKVTVVEKGEHRELVCNSVPLHGLMGRYTGTIITGVDITEALERRRLVNWAQLAHDMQTNLSTIRLNAEQLQSSPVEPDAERRRRILFQVGVLIQRVRDLVSVGRSENLERGLVHSAELCTEIRHEFDPGMFPHVTFSMKLRGTMMNVDRLKLSRAIRNAVENGIKALRGQPGQVEIATWFDRTYVYVRVSDTGAGMDAHTLANMMRPYFTTSKDGSGTGIGTMIMQHVVHLHNGSLRVSSQLGAGTQVVFRIPHGMEGPRLRNARYAVEEDQ